jgi:hypothetical protein
MTNEDVQLGRHFWTPVNRGVVFFLSAMSIWCLLAEFYGLCTMRTFTLYVFLPATALLVIMAAADGAAGDRRLLRNVLVGAAAGLLAAFSYDVFRLPFVFARVWHLSTIIPPLPLFKVFPRFGAMILGEPVEQPAYSMMAQFVGWAYHFSNGVTFGVMYLAALGDARRRSWLWAVVMAVGLELAMLFTPYPGMFSIRVTPTFAWVTLVAHLIFGVVLGLTCRAMMRRLASDPAPVDAGALHPA